MNGDKSIKVISTESKANGSLKKITISPKFKKNENSEENIIPKLLSRITGLIEENKNLRFQLIKEQTRADNLESKLKNIIQIESCSKKESDRIPLRLNKNLEDSMESKKDTNLRS